MLTFNPGDHHELPIEDCPTTEIAFGISLFAAIVQGSARCRGIAPGVSMRIQSGQPPVAPQDLEDWCAGIWDQVAPGLRQWLNTPADAAEHRVEFVVDLPPVKARFVRDSLGRLPAAVIQLDAVCKEFGTVDGKQERNRSHLPSRVLAPNPFPERVVRDKPQPHVLNAIDHALGCSLESIRRDLMRLPLVVRTRASGALHAWQEALRIAGRPGTDFRARLEDGDRNPNALRDDLRTFLLQGGAAHLKAARQGDIITHACINVLAVGFWLRRGVLYEPTPALDELLGVSDIAENFPVTALTLSTPAMCIVPPRSGQTFPRKLDSILIFEHSGQPGSDAGQRWITFVAAQAPDPNIGEWAVESLDLRIDSSSDTIDSVVRRHLDRAGREQELHFWQHTLNYLIKVMLYLSSATADIRPDHSWSAAPREFRGLGKRKRQERLALIDQLYDRYVIGPEVLPTHQEETGVPSGMHEEEFHERRPHWRRGHFRAQAHGPGNTLRKVIFVMPMIVRSDRLGSVGGTRGID